MKKAIITGSETFGQYITNPSKWLALSVDKKVIAGYEMHSLVFPSIVLIKLVSISGYLATDTKLFITS